MLKKTITVLNALKNENEQSNSKATSELFSDSLVEIIVSIEGASSSHTQKRQRKRRSNSFSDLNMFDLSLNAEKNTATYNSDTIKIDTLKELLKSKTPLKLTKIERTALNKADWAESDTTELLKKLSLRRESPLSNKSNHDELKPTDLEELVDIPTIPLYLILKEGLLEQLQAMAARFIAENKSTKRSSRKNDKMPTTLKTQVKLPSRALIAFAIASGSLMLGTPAALMSSALLTTLYAQAAGLSGLVSSPASIATLVVAIALTIASTAVFGMSIHHLRFPKGSKNSVLSNDSTQSASGSNNNKQADT